MTITPYHAEIHDLVDKLTPLEAEALYVLLKSIVGDRPNEPEPLETMLTDEPVRRFSLSGSINTGPRNAAAWAKELLGDQPSRPDTP
jgi:hypothetical protein